MNFKEKQKRQNIIILSCIGGVLFVLFILAIIFGDRLEDSLSTSSKVQSSTVPVFAETSSEIISAGAASFEQTSSTETSSAVPSRASVTSSKPATVTSKSVSTATTSNQAANNNTPSKAAPNDTTPIEVNGDMVFSRNEIATVSITGKPNTTYSITVYYSSGASKADGLENKTSDANGKVSWSWKIGGRTKPGTYNIVITGGGQTLEKAFTVI